MPQPTAINPEERAEAEDAARELLRDLVGPDYSDTTLRVCADHLLSFRRHPKTHAEQPPVAALDRLFALAKSDTGQSARVANFLLAWWNGTDLGHFPIADLFGLDRSVADDITSVVRYLGRHPGAVYADSLGYRGDVMDLLHRWRDIGSEDAA